VINAVSLARSAGPALSRLRCLAPIESWLPRTSSIPRLGATGAARDGFGPPFIPWDAIAWADLTTTEANVDEPGPVGRSGRSAEGQDAHRPSAAPTDVPSRNGHPALNGTAGPADPHRSGSATRETIEQPTTALSLPVDRGSKQAATVLGSTGAKVGENSPPSPSQYPPSAGSSRTQVARSAADQDGPRPPTSSPAGAADDVQHPEAAAAPATIDPGKAQPPKTRPLGALGELIGRWEANGQREADSNGPSPNGQPADYGAANGRVRAGLEPNMTAGSDRRLPSRRQASPASTIEPKHAIGREPDFGRPAGSAKAAPPGPNSASTLVQDERLLEVLDAALSELMRRDAERHGLGWIDP